MAVAVRPAARPAARPAGRVAVLVAKVVAKVVVLAARVAASSFFERLGSCWLLHGLESVGSLAGFGHFPDRQEHLHLLEQIPRVRVARGSREDRPLGGDDVVSRDELAFVEVQAQTVLGLGIAGFRLGEEISR